MTSGVFRRNQYGFFEGRLQNIFSEYGEFSHLYAIVDVSLVTYISYTLEASKRPRFFEVLAHFVNQVSEFAVDYSCVRIAE